MKNFDKILFYNRSYIYFFQENPFWDFNAIQKVIKTIKIKILILLTKKTLVSFWCLWTFTCMQLKKFRGLIYIYITYDTNFMLLCQTLMCHWWHTNSPAWYTYYKKTTQLFWECRWLFTVKIWNALKYLTLKRQSRIKKKVTPKKSLLVQNTKHWLVGGLNQDLVYFEFFRSKNIIMYFSYI